MKKSDKVFYAGYAATITRFGKDEVDIELQVGGRWVTYTFSRERAKEVLTLID